MTIAQRPVAALVLSVGLAACAAPAQPPCEAGLVPVREITALFGRHVTRAGATPRRITDTEWVAFVAMEITPRFPRGSTVTDARGTWRHPETGAAVTEDSSILLLIVPAEEAPGAIAALRAAAAAYRERHAQDAVGLLARPACATGFF